MCIRDHLLKYYIDTSTECKHRKISFDTKHISFICFPDRGFEDLLKMFNHKANNQQ